MSRKSNLHLHAAMLVTLSSAVSCLNPNSLYYPLSRQRDQQGGRVGRPARVERTRAGQEQDQGVISKSFARIYHTPIMKDRCNKMFGSSYGQFVSGMYHISV